MKRYFRFLFPCSSSKEIGRLYSVLATNKKLSRSKNQQLFWVLREGRTHSRNRKDRQGNTRCCSFPEQRLESRNCCGNQSLDRAAKVVTDELLETQCGQVGAKSSRGTQSLGDPLKHCEIYSHELNQVLTINIIEQSPQASGRGMNKGTILKYARALCFS